MSKATPEIKSFKDAQNVLARFMPTPKRPAKARVLIDDVRALLEFLGNPQDKYKTLHVAGTSGKTSTCYYAAAILRAAGMKVGLTVSPHVDQINERAQINLIPLPEAKFCKLFSEFLRAIEKSKIRPSYITALVTFAYWVFAKEKVDYAVVEVGMGGLLDPTNAISRQDKVCIITDIGLDHTEFLGNTLASIATQKAGIIHYGNRVFCLKQASKISQAIRETCIQKQASLHELALPSKDYLPQNLPLYQQRNWFLALQACGYVFERDGLPKLNKHALGQASQVYIPARMEQKKANGKTLILDVAHNYQKIQALAKSVKSKYPNQKIAVLFGLAQSGDDRTSRSTRAVLNLADYLIITSFNPAQNNPKKPVNPKSIAKLCESLDFKNYTVIPEPERAYEALKKRPEKILIATGSFYLMNHIRPLSINISLPE